MITEIQIKQVIGQQEASIAKIESLLTDEEFREYCDAITVTMTYWRRELKKLINMNIDFNKEIYEGWTVLNFIDETREVVNSIMSHESITDVFENKEQLRTWLKDNQPYYKKDIPEVIEYFANKYNLE